MFGSLKMVSWMNQCEKLHISHYKKIGVHLHKLIYLCNLLTYAKSTTLDKKIRMIAVGKDRTINDKIH